MGTIHVFLLSIIILIIIFKNFKIPPPLSLTIVVTTLTNNGHDITTPANCLNGIIRAYTQSRECQFEAPLFFIGADNSYCSCYVNLAPKLIRLWATLGRCA